MPQQTQAIWTPRDCVLEARRMPGQLRQRLDNLAAGCVPNPYGGKQRFARRSLLDIRCRELAAVRSQCNFCNISRTLNALQLFTGLAVSNADLVGPLIAVALAAHQRHGKALAVVTRRKV